MIKGNKCENQLVIESKEVLGFCDYISKSHTEITLKILRESDKLRKIFTELYA